MINEWRPTIKCRKFHKSNNNDDDDKIGAERKKSNGMCSVTAFSPQIQAETFVGDFLPIGFFFSFSIGKVHKLLIARTHTLTQNELEAFLIHSNEKCWALEWFGFSCFIFVAVLVCFACVSKNTFFLYIFNYIYTYADYI